MNSIQVTQLKELPIFEFKNFDVSIKQKYYSFEDSLSNNPVIDYYFIFFKVEGDVYQLVNQKNNVRQFKTVDSIFNLLRTLSCSSTKTFTVKHLFS